MTQYLSKQPFTVPPAVKVQKPCTATQHAWPIRDGRGGYVCWYCPEAPCTVDGQPVGETST